MAIWAISDLHLSFGIKNKPMDIFGENWVGYEEKLRMNWCERIKEEDTVIMAGDFSWGMYLNETIEDFNFLESLPGRKIMIKGNHDYWWETASKLNKFKDENEYKKVYFLHNNFFEAEGLFICGTRGWEKGLDEYDKEQDAKIYKREKDRLEYSLKLANSSQNIIAVLHYNVGENPEYVEILKKYRVKKCIFGHLHGKVSETKLYYEKDDIEFMCTSCDLLNFIPIKIN